ncbi:MAG: translational GTPase TypA [Acholeplasmatales bacterium]|jgi:GTP-binding protein|nr:translational GTPase TypA [Acholeplasmatales bacterium]
MDIRNIAIIAHVDHGKTTLVDKLLKQSHAVKDYQVMAERAMDSNDLERERGITILAKNTAINYKEYKINILDTPGHADFGGEVERIMTMVDGVLLLVDAFEGVMPQTKFVLKKALEAKLLPIVVINKMDRDGADAVKALNEVFDLFIDLNATDSQLDFPVIYASGLNGIASLKEDMSDAVDMIPIFETIIKYIPTPAQDSEGVLLFQSALIDYNDYVGRIGIGRITRGKVSTNDFVSCLRLDGTTVNFRVQKIFQYIGLIKQETPTAYAGDIVGISGLADMFVGETITNVGSTEKLPVLKVDDPTVQMTFLTNTSPFSGKEGKWVTASKIEERLSRETKKDVALKIERMGGVEAWLVSGRGELHLEILIENMRREGFEFAVSRPKVITKNIDGVLSEPYESVQVDIPSESVGDVIDLLGNRKADLISMHTYGNNTRINYEMPSRALIGLLTQFLTATKGYGILNHNLLEYRPASNYVVGSRQTGALISMSGGMVTAYALHKLEERGNMFVDPRTEVYEGMIVGESNKDTDIIVNIIQEKQQTNMRSSSKDTTIVLKKNITMTLEMCLAFINDDELVEITPKSIRIRKYFLTLASRKKNFKYGNVAEVDED